MEHHTAPAHGRSRADELSGHEPRRSGPGQVPGLPGTKYPPTLIATADHDDRVVPGHSFKFAETMQADQAGPAAVLIRIETKAGHGAGKPISKIIDETADEWAFVAYNLKMDVKLQ